MYTEYICNIATVLCGPIHSLTATHSKMQCIFEGNDISMLIDVQFLINSLNRIFLNKF